MIRGSPNQPTWRDHMEKPCEYKERERAAHTPPAGTSTGTPPCPSFSHQLITSIWDPKAELPKNLTTDRVRDKRLTVVALSHRVLERFVI